MNPTPPRPILVVGDPSGRAQQIAAAARALGLDAQLTDAGAAEGAARQLTPGAAVLVDWRDHVGAVRLGRRLRAAGARCVVLAGPEELRGKFHNLLRVGAQVDAYAVGPPELVARAAAEVSPRLPARGRWVRVGARGAALGALLALLFVPRDASGLRIALGGAALAALAASWALSPRWRPPAGDVF